MSRTTHARARRTAVALGSTALIAGIGVVMAAFTATTANPGNSISTGTVAIEDNDGGNSPSTGTAMFTVTNAKPTTAISRCIRVTYKGSLPSTVKLYSADAAALPNAGEFTVQVDRVTLGATPPAVTADCVAASDSVALTSRDLSTFPVSYAAPTAIPGKPADATWALNDAVDYKITITPKDNAVPNARTTALAINPFTFTWEAQNS